MFETRGIGLVLVLVLICCHASQEGGPIEAVPDQVEKNDQPTPTSPPTPKCATRNSCGECIALECGWCAATSSCHRGNERGPYFSPCNMSTWTYSSCPDSFCANFSSCDTCTNQPLCGWCGGTGLCSAGTANGPFSDDCNGDDWSWLSSECSSSRNCSLTLACSFQEARYRSCNKGMGVFTKTGHWCEFEGVEYCCSDCCRLNDGLITAVVLFPLLLFAACLLKFKVYNQKRKRDQHDLLEMSQVIPFPLATANGLVSDTRTVIAIPQPIVPVSNTGDNSMTISVIAVTHSPTETQPQPQTS